MQSTSSPPRSWDRFCSSWQCRRRSMSCVAPPISRPGKPPENQGLVDFHFCGCANWPAGQTWCYCRGCNESSWPHAQGGGWSKTEHFSTALHFFFPSNYMEVRAPTKVLELGWQMERFQPCQPSGHIHHQSAGKPWETHAGLFKSKTKHCCAWKLGAQTEPDPVLCTFALPIQEFSLTSEVSI